VVEGDVRPLINCVLEEKSPPSPANGLDPLAPSPSRGEGMFSELAICHLHLRYRLIAERYRFTVSTIPNVSESAISACPIDTSSGCTARTNGGKFSKFKS
jgi:hypothetical protein